MENVYNTTDPQKLLELRRLEADALRDVLRTINSSALDIENLCLISRNLLRAQLGVKRMVFYYEAEGEWHNGIRTGFPLFEAEDFSEVLRSTKVVPVTPETHPRLQRMGAEYVLPVSNRQDIQAFFVVADFADSDYEAKNDLIFIETLANIMTVAIRNKLLFDSKIQQESLRREIEVASTIQSQLLISDFSRFREVDVYAFNRPHQGVGGDFFDIIKKGKGTTFFCIADVSGKGIGAALLMSNLQANLRALCAQYDDLPSIINELNSLLYGITGGEKFVTLFLGKFEREKRSLEYVNAGHNPPIITTGHQQQNLSEGCMLLGIVPELKINQGNIRVESGDLLFLFTDGVTEQTNKQGLMYGHQRLEEELLELKASSAREVLDHMAAKLDQYAQNVSPSDDITMMAIRFV